MDCFEGDELMRRFTKILLCVTVVALVGCSVQSISAEQILPIKGLFVSEGKVNLVTTEGTDYKIYLQLVIRNADGHLINVTESTANGAYVAHMLSDHVFDTLLNEKEIITIDGTKYEKGTWRFNPSVETRFVALYPIFSESTLEISQEVNENTAKMYGESKDFSIWKIHYCADWDAWGFHCVPVFQVLVPNMTIEPTDTVEMKWTILREAGQTFGESTETSKWHMVDP